MGAVIDVLVKERVSITTCGRFGCIAELYKVYEGIGECVEPVFHTELIPCEENCNCDHSM